jgi:hypothetical protein
MRLKVYLFALIFMAGLVVVDGYQDTAGHHDMAGSSMCQTSCASHMVVPNTVVAPVISQTHPIVEDQFAITSLTIVQSIFNPPKVLA